ncbi:glycosyltransferase family 4 protein [Peteryoungia algae]|uniref:Glycosyltransferase family 4 protein n=1 Tax=Peteryoungia algae TaxID=2919917 RepID=A0ABT0D012_9HYPH|nr:glycosyltransferase family 4 protein [Rhizobium sp. SSM4.3]MCJ8238711.1 glycosyltransferase family 4 protein [Rhizobium sp. SSM4.3]
MRVLIVSQYYWPENFLINDLTSLLAAAGLEVTVLTGKPNYPEGDFFAGYRSWGVQREFHDGVSIVRVPIARRGKQSRIRLAMNYASFIIAASTLGLWSIRRQKYDVVFVYAPSPLLQALPALLFARMNNAKLFVWVQDLWPESLSATGYLKNAVIMKFVAALVRLIYISSDRILVQSEAFVDRVAQYTERRKIRYFPNLYRPAATQEPSDRAKRLAADMMNSFAVVFAGNLGAAQSLDTIIDAAEQLKARCDIRFYIIGSGSRGQWLAKQVKDRDLSNVELCGRFEASDMPALLQAAGSLLVTLAADEIFALTVPSKLQAYLSAGKCIIASINGEGARIVDAARAGLVSASEDAGALAKSIETMADLPVEERNSMGARGAAYFEANFSADMLTRDLIGQFRELAGKEEAI